MRTSVILWLVLALPITADAQPKLVTKLPADPAVTVARTGDAPHLVVPVVVTPTPLPVPMTIEVGQTLEIQIQGMDAAQAAKVDLTYYPRPTGIRCKPVSDWKGTGYRIDFAAPMIGVYLVKIDSADSSGVVVGSEVEVTVGTPVPPGPPVPPTPPIPPSPIPVVQKVQVIAVEETANSTPSWSRVRNSVAIRNWAAGGGHRVFFIDQDALKAAGGTWKTYADMSSGQTLPYVVITDLAGTVLDKEPAPLNEKDFLALVQKWGGVGTTCANGVCPLIQGAK